MNLRKKRTLYFLQMTVTCCSTRCKEGALVPSFHGSSHDDDATVDEAELSRKVYLLRLRVDTDLALAFHIKPLLFKIASWPLLIKR